VVITAFLEFLLVRMALAFVVALALANESWTRTVQEHTEYIHLIEDGTLAQ